MRKKVLLPVDRLSFATIFLLTLLIALLIWGGENCGANCFLHRGPNVTNFSWQQKQIGAKDRAFILTFDRPMDRATVTENLVIDPPLSGKISWAGRRIAYTLNSPAPYGIEYKLKLEKARSRFIGQEQAGELMEPFVGKFSTRDRAFAYIGSKGEQKGRLILYNFTEKRKIILTPPDLVVVDFKPYPQGDLLLFSALPKVKDNEGLQNLQLYTVTTGISSDRGQHFKPNKIELILDNKKYQNNEFKLSEDGKIIVVQRINRQNPEEFDLWRIKERNKPQPLKIQGGEFLIAPDSQTLAIAQGQGIALLPLEPEAKPLDFLPKFGRVLNFSRDGKAAAMVNYNTDNANLSYTRSLFYVNNQGIQKELLNTEGSILNCQFSPTATDIYCLLTEVLEEEKEYIERPYLAKINIKTSSVTPLIAWPNYQDIKFSIAPDGLGIIFDQVITSNNSESINTLRTNSGEAIVDGHLWLLIPSVDRANDSNNSQLEELPLVGFNPQWLP